MQGLFCLFLLLMGSCTRDAYEKGEGAYSLMRGDFAEANVNSNCEVTSITTDDGETLPLTILQTAQWISSPDTIYRCMGKYLNLHLQLKTGYTEDSTAVQKLNAVSDTLITYPDGQRTLSVLLYHDQANVPEYYSTQAYVSIPTTGLGVDSIRLYINTYSGPVIKTLPLQ